MSQSLLAEAATQFGAGSRELLMLFPMSPTDSLFLLTESREHPMHVGSLQLFQPPEGAGAIDVRSMFDAAIATDQVAPLFRKRARRSITSLGQWGWVADEEFDLEHHVRRNALPRPGRVLELLTLCSRLHSSLLDRHRPLWEIHLIEGLEDGRYAVYFKVHHALVDGVAATRMLSRMLSEDPAQRDMPAPWALRERERRTDTPTASGRAAVPFSAVRGALDALGEAAGLVPILARSLNPLNEQSGSLSFSAPKTMFNVAITGARRFAAQSWPMERIRQVGEAGEATINDVVLALCSGALRAYMQSLDALPDASLIAMVPVSLHTKDSGSGDGGASAASRPRFHDRGQGFAQGPEPDPDPGDERDRDEPAHAALGAAVERRHPSAVQPGDLERARAAQADVLERCAPRRALPAVDPA